MTTPATSYCAATSTAFVDEHQDIDEAQYALVSALAGRRLADPDARVSIMDVGDNDQNPPARD
jgi:superfamily I DNA/RNA helicase